VRFHLFMECPHAYQGSDGYYSDVVKGEQQGGVYGLHGQHQGVGAEIVDKAQCCTSQNVLEPDRGALAVLILGKE